ncbi:MAG: hypothetical protein ACSHX5_01835 [Phycisphaerales bacterium]
MKTKPITVLSLVLGLALSMNACTEQSSSSSSHSHGDETHSHTEDNHAAEDMHESIPLGSMMINDFTVELAQGHGAVHAGEEEHLIVKLQSSEDEVLAIRAWIGTEDKTLSYVGKGEYSADRDVYDVHMIAPQSLDPDAMWWVELELRDGTIKTGSMKVIQ